MLALPAKLLLMALFGWAGAPGYVSAQRTRFVRSVFANEWAWAATRAQWQGQGPEQNPGCGAFFSVAAPSLHHSLTPFLHLQDSLQPSRPLPYRVEAGSLPAQAVQVPGEIG